MFAGGVEDADLATVDDGDDLMAGVFGADVDAGGAGVDGAVCGHHAGVHGGRVRGLVVRAGLVGGSGAATTVAWFHVCSGVRPARA